MLKLVKALALEFIISINNKRIYYFIAIFTFLNEAALNILSIKVSL